MFLKIVSKSMTKKTRFKEDFHSLPVLTSFVAEITGLSPGSFILSFVDSDGEVVVIKDHYDMEYFVENAAGRTFAVIRVEEDSGLNQSFNIVEDDQVNGQSPALQPQINAPENMIRPQVHPETEVNTNFVSEITSANEKAQNESAFEVISTDNQDSPQDEGALAEPPELVQIPIAKNDNQPAPNEQLVKSISLDSIDEIKQMLNNAMVLRALLSEKESKNETQELQGKIAELEQELKAVKEISRANQEAQSRITQHLDSQPSRPIDTKTVHKNTWCAKCKTYPITGKRFKCLVCPNYSLCQGCEAIEEHPHSMIKCTEPVTKHFFDKIQNKFAKYSKQETKVQEQISSLPYELFYEPEETPNPMPSSKRESRRSKYKKNKHSDATGNRFSYFKEYSLEPQMVPRANRLPKKHSQNEAREEKKKLVRFMLNTNDEVAIDELVNMHEELDLTEFIQKINSNFRSARE